MLDLPTPGQFEDICQVVFGLQYNHVDPKARTEYYEYLRGEIQRVPLGSRAKILREAAVEVDGFDDVCKLMKTLSNCSDTCLSDIRTLSRQKLGLTSEASLDPAIFLAMRLLYMINVQTTRPEALSPGSRTLPWEAHITITEYMTIQFPKDQYNISARESRLHPYFTAANLERICKLKIKWTDSLADHLRLNRHTKHPTLYVFPHKRCLLQLLRARKAGQAHLKVVPEAALRDAIRSIDLLFPPLDARTDQLLRRENMTFHNLKDPITGPRPLNLQNFEYWQGQLLELYEEVFLSPPATWAQLWSDRRSPQQWLTFWLALIIAVLTLVSTIATIVQTWATLKGSN